MEFTTTTKQELLKALDRLVFYITTNFDEDKSDELIKELESACDYLSSRFPRCFGSQGYEKAIFNR